MIARRDGRQGTRGLIVVWGVLAHAPFGGMTWQVLHHLVGLRRLGFDVWYVEDSDQRLLNLSIDDWSADAHANAGYLARYMRAVGMQDRWAFRLPGTKECVGALDWPGVLRLYRDADAVLNLCGAHKLRDCHDVIRRLVYVETDPVATQVGVARGNQRTIDELARYDGYVTYATNLGNPDCLIPDGPFPWQPTVPPVVVSSWATRAPVRRRAFTTVMNWSSPEGVVSWQGHEWQWSKRPTFEHFAALPAAAPADLEVAMRGAGPGVWDGLAQHGWHLVPAPALDRPGRYRRYIRDSMAELAVAKEQYVGPRSGWISDRTVCYLAAGRPAVVQRTGIHGIPLGEGLLDFATTAEAHEAMGSVVDDYDRHAKAATELAREHFAAEGVLERMLTQVGLT